MDEVDIGIEDFELIFAFPWPGEETLFFDLFETYAARGAHLMTYHGEDEGILVHVAS